MPEDEFESEIVVSEKDLRFEPFTETVQVRSFDSGSKPLDDFLNTEEVAEYQREGRGVTT